MRFGILCACLALLYAGDVMAGNTWSSNNRRRSNTSVYDKNKSRSSRSLSRDRNTNVKENVTKEEFYDAIDFSDEFTDESIDENEEWFDAPSTEMTWENIKKQSSKELLLLQMTR